MDDLRSESSPQPVAKELVVVANQSGLELESAQFLGRAFQPLFEQAEDWRLKVAGIKVTDASQTREMELARQSRLALKEIRVKAEHLRKQLKEDSLRRGKAIDGMYNIIAYLTEPLEKELLAQEQFVERQEADRKARLKAEREEALKPYGIDTSVYLLGEMKDDAFNQLLVSCKVAHEAKLAAAQKAEEERLAKEEADRVERERLRIDNERLQREAKERDDALKAEQERQRIARDAEQKQRLAEQAERDRLAAAERAEIQRKADEAAAVARREADQLRLAQEAEVEKRRKIEAELAAEREAQRQKEAEDAELARKAAAAPDKEKLLALVDRIKELQIPQMATPEGDEIASAVAKQRDRFASWVSDKASTL